MKITIVPESVIRNFGDMFYSPHILISIRTPNQEHFNLMKNKNRKAALILRFHDVDVEKEGMLAFSGIDAVKILDFIDKWKDCVDEIVINCNAGLSRSPGVGAALSSILNGDDEEFFRRHMMFNRLVYKTILEEYNRRQETQTDKKD